MGGCLSVQRDEPSFNELARHQHRQHVEEIRSRTERPHPDDREMRFQAENARRRARDEAPLTVAEWAVRERPHHDHPVDSLEPPRRDSTDEVAEELRRARMRFEHQREMDPLRPPDPQNTVNLPWGYKLQVSEQLTR